MAKLITVFRAVGCGHYLGFANSAELVQPTRDVLDFNGLNYTAEQTELTFEVTAEAIAQRSCDQCRPNPPQETLTP